MEATIDPALTLGRDILPRFQKTSKFQQMNDLLEDLKKNNGAHDLTVPFPHLPPVGTPTLPMNDPNHRYNLEETLSHPLLYEALLEYATRVMSAEIVLGMRLVLLYEEQFREGKHVAAKETGLSFSSF
jgi:hypothetical protein